MSYSIVFGPAHLGGAGFVRWSTLQGEGQVMLFLKHWRAHDDAGQLLRIALAWMQFQAGTSVPVLQDVQSRLPHIESRWLPALRNFLATIDGKIYTDKTYIAPRQRHGDEYIMDAILAVDEFSDKEIHVLNCCRMYLNVITVSDLVDATGTRMDACIACHLPSYSSHSKLHIPVQDRPSNWRLWDIVMHRWFNATGVLHRPLGPWLFSGDQLRRLWSFYYDSIDGCIYQRICDGFVRYARVSRGYGRQDVTDWRPRSSSFPIAVHVNAGILYPEHPPCQPPANDPSPVLATFHDYVQTLQSWEQPLLTGIRFFVEPYQLLALLHTPNSPVASSNADRSARSIQLCLVSDGSNVRDRMSFGWTFALPDGTRLAENSGPGYGPGTSHRAEGYGVLSAVQFIIRLQEYLVIREPWVVRFVSDNKGLITRLQQRQQYSIVYPNSTLEPDWDLVEQIITSLSFSGLQHTFAHVKGHQDDNVPYADLSLDAQMNVDADRLAGEYNSDFPSSATSVPMLPVTGAHLQLGTRTITSRYVCHIRTEAGTPDYLNYIQRKNYWDDCSWQTVDLIVLRRVIACHAHQYVTVVKLLHDYLPTSALRQYTDPTVVHYCELCHAEQSTFRHVILCPHPTRQEWRRNFLQAIQIQCEISQTRLGIMQSILSGIKNWFSGAASDPRQYPAAFRDAVLEQNVLGWHGFLRGFCSTSWSRLQDEHLKHNKLQTPNNNGTSWLVSLVTVMWQHLFRLWDDYKSTVHGADQQAMKHQAVRRIQTKIRMLHESARSIRVEDQRWLLKDLERYLATSTLSQMQRWHATYEPVIVDAMQLARDSSVANTRSLRSYFQSLSQPSGPLQLAARVHRRAPRVHDAMSQSKTRQHKPRPKLPYLPSIRKYFRPMHLIPPQIPVSPDGFTPTR